jgi:hypothetical protein
MATQIPSTTFCSDNNDANGSALKVAPPVEIQQTGLFPQSPMARIWFNYYLNMLTSNSQFLQDEVLGVGAVLSFVDGTEPDFATDFIGTWVATGTQSIGGTTVAYFKRTA